jgi:hypothetical protein
MSVPNVQDKTSVAAEMATHSGGFEDGEMDKEVINLPSRWAK